ncbi:MAG: hypothetical protein ACE15C_02940 [Phycisphaerae bacterium]
MRPAPKAQSRKAVLIFVAVAAAYGLFALRDTRLSDTQVYMSTAALKYHNQSLYPHDPIFGASGLWRFYTPAMHRVLGTVLGPTDYDDMAIPFRILVGFVTLLYLCGMFALLYRQCQSWSIAAFTAVLSSAIIYTLGRSYWGVGSLASITPWTLCQVFAPLIVLAFLHYQDNWPRLLLVFAAIGLLGNIHLVVAANLTIVLAIVYLGQRWFSPRAWAGAIACCLMAVLCAMPYLIYYSQLRASLGPAGPTSYKVVFQAFGPDLGDMPVLYPEILKLVLNWIIVIAGVLLMPAAMVLSRVERYRVRDIKVWVWFMGGAVAVAMGLQGVFQLIGRQTNSAPLTIDFVQAASLMMLPMYVLLAQAITFLFRLVRTHRLLLRLALAAVTAAWMIPSDNLRTARHDVLDAATMFMNETDKPSRVRELHDRKARMAELTAIGRYVCDNTGVGAVFITDNTDFRMLSRRSVVACPDDAKYIYYLAPWKLGEWVNVVKRQRSLMHLPDGEAIRRFAIDMRRKPEFEGATEWYVVIQSRKPLDKPGGLKQKISTEWGRYFQLYEVPLTDAATAPGG